MSELSLKHQQLKASLVFWVKECKKAGLMVVADASGNGAIRLIPVAELTGEGLSAQGEEVGVDDACSR
jgi:hypothetical protein